MSQQLVRICVLAVFILSGTVSQAWSAGRKTGGTTAFVDVRVVSMNPDDSKKVRKHQTVLVEKGLITVMGPVGGVQIPAKAEILNGNGKLYLLPGLNDMHVHHAGVPSVEENLTPQDVYTLAQTPLGCR